MSVYLKRIMLEHIGPINNIDYNFSFTADGIPKPLLIVGSNGAGKTLFQAHIFNSLMNAKQAIYTKMEVEHGKLFKYRKPSYIKSGESYYYAEVEYTNQLNHKELQLNATKKNYLVYNQPVAHTDCWNSLNDHDHSILKENFLDAQFHEKVLDLIDNQCLLYFPANRYEDPAWLNKDNLNATAKLSCLSNIQGEANRNSICTSPMTDIKNWLLDVICDTYLVDLRPVNAQFAGCNPALYAVPEESPNVKLWGKVNDILETVLNKKNLHLRMGARHNRTIQIAQNDGLWIPNIFQLSTGELQLLSLFFSIIRDADYAKNSTTLLSDIKGIVLIDEIDAHLHSSHQKSILPHLMKLFPKIQFIITTHSPLFLLGMEEEYGEDNIEIISLPEGERILASDFAEFQKAYDTIKQTTKFRAEIEKAIMQSNRPILFVEGPHDVSYLETAAKILGYEDLYKLFDVKPASGCGQLKRIWKERQKGLYSDFIRSFIILLNDFDTQIKPESHADKIYRRIIPFISENPLTAGIENLFSQRTIDKVMNTEPSYILKKEIKEFNDPANPSIKVTYEINEGKKKSLCQWLCSNGTEDDFTNFKQTFKDLQQLATDKGLLAPKK
ncbi:MAG: AAA family ATPase [Desulfovibrionales bacterium]|nr:AAA family ATPase [Desulfovibrionales bacterium]